jgi:DNA-binding LacI/PurR family transcriptional regulator
MKLTYKIDAHDPQMEKTVNQVVTEIAAKYPNERKGIFVAGGTQLLWNVLYEMRAQHLDIPRDLAICSIDSTWQWCQLIQPGITAIYQPCFELGEAAAVFLVNRMQGTCDEKPQRKILKATLTIGNSTAAIPN